MAPEMPREQEQSIKARKRELFDAQGPASGPRKRFAEYLSTTPPTPLSKGQKIILWAVGGFAVLLFVAAMLTIPGPRRGRSPAPKAPQAQAGAR